MPSLPSTSPPARRTVLLLMCVVACGHFNRVGISVAGTERIIPAYGISAKQMGMVYSAFLVFYTLAMFPGGWFIDRFGARRARRTPGLCINDVRRFDRLCRPGVLRGNDSDCGIAGGAIAAGAGLLRRCTQGRRGWWPMSCRRRRGQGPSAGLTSRLAWGLPRRSLCSAADRSI